jgi:hypothetical protein
MDMEILVVLAAVLQDTLILVAVAQVQVLLDKVMQVAQVAGSTIPVVGAVLGL